MVLRAMALLRLDQGAGPADVACLVPLTEQAIRNVAHRYRRGGLATAPYERPRPGAAEMLAPRGSNGLSRWRAVRRQPAWRGGPFA